jgi:hypothetical protein
VTPWTLSVLPTCTPTAGHCAKSVWSWAFIGAQLANSSRAPVSRCVRALVVVKKTEYKLEGVVRDEHAEADQDR